MCNRGQGRSRKAPPVTRRAVVSAIAGGPVAFLAGRADAQSTDPRSIRQPDDPTRRSFMDRAEAMRDLALRRGDQGFGAVIVKRGRIVGQAPSRVVTGNDPTAHAEIEAIRHAAATLGTRDLSGCVMFGTSRACPMCETAAYWAKLDRLFHGSGIADAGSPRYRHC